MIDLHTQEVLEELQAHISEHLEDNEELDDDDRFAAAEDLLQDILEKISALVDRDG